MCNKGVTHLVVPSKRGGDSNNGNFFPQNPKNFKTQDIYIYIYIYEYEIAMKTQQTTCWS
jgi:uncharacterized protein involved in tellurium resistance